MAQGHDDKSDGDALHARLDKLSKSLGPGKTSSTETGNPSPGADSGMGQAMGAGVRVVTEIVAGVMVGGGLGWLLDKWLHTGPLLMIVLGSLGLMGGFWNVIRVAMRPPGSGPGRFGG